MNWQQSSNLQDQTIEKEVYNDYYGWIETVKISIKFTLNQKIIYSQNGAILRVIEGPDVLNQPEIFQNMDQILNLSWQGQYDQNKKQDGKWVAYWDKELIRNVGGYYKEGQKQGLWKDLFQNYSNQSQIFEIGEYYNDFRIGRWNCIYKGSKIGGWNYNKDGWKQGKWIELDEGFDDDKNVTYHGEYNMNGMKVGRWVIMYCSKYGYGKYRQIYILQNLQEYLFTNIYSGGGQYDQERNQKKYGKWVELDEVFHDLNQVTFNGEYGMKGQKVGILEEMNGNCKRGEKRYND